MAGPANAPSVALLRQEAKGVWDAASSVSAGRHQFVRLLLAVPGGGGLFIGGRTARELSEGFYGLVPGERAQVREQDKGSHPVLAFLWF